MYKKLLLILAILTFLHTSLFAEEKKPQTSTDEKPYVGIGLGIIDPTGFDTGYSLLLHAGKSLPKVAEHFGLEGAFSTTVIEPSIFNTDLSVTTLAAYATYKVNLTPEVDFKAKGGILYERLSSTITDDSFEVTYGLKVLYKLKSKKAIFLDYTIIEKDIAIFSVGLEF